MSSGLLYITHPLPLGQAAVSSSDVILRLVDEAFSQPPPLILLYNNTNLKPDENPPLLDTLVLVPINELDFFNQKWWRDRQVKQDEVDLDVRLYETLQVYEGFEKKDWRAKCIVAAANEPALGQDEEFDEWYRKQHLPMLSMVAGYRRSNRYKFVSTLLTNELQRGVEVPRYLGLHEFDSPDYDRKQLRQPALTEWSRKIVTNYRHFERNDWILAFELGDKLKPL